MDDCQLRSQGISTVRQAQISDAQELAEIIVNSFYSSNLGLFWWLSPFFQFTVAEDLRYRLNQNPPLYECLVAIPTQGGKSANPVGTVEIAIKRTFWLPDKNQYPYISNLAVKSSYRRRGIATGLLSRCEKVALSWGYDAIQLHVLDQNQQAKQLYLKCGFQIIAREPHWNGFFNPSAVRLLMRKKLTTKQYT